MPPAKRPAIGTQSGFGGAPLRPPPPGTWLHRPSSTGDTSTSVPPKVGPPPPFVSPDGGGPPPLPSLSAGAAGINGVNGVANGRPNQVDLTRVAGISGVNAAASVRPPTRVDLTHDDAGSAVQSNVSAAGVQAQSESESGHQSMKERADRKAAILAKTRAVIKAALDSGRINRKQYKRVAKAVVDAAMQREKSASRQLTDGKLEMIATTFVEKAATADVVQDGADRVAAQGPDGEQGGNGEGGEAGVRSEKRASSSSSLHRDRRDSADEPLKRIKIDQELAISKVQNWL